MTPFVPQLEVSVDQTTGSIRTATIRVRNGAVHQRREIAEGRVFADYSAAGELLGISLLAPCGIGVLDRIADQEPDHVRRFLRGCPPRELVSV
jgi:hypothetical protein